jgi:DNA-binding transcriptional LysR family regulator
MLASNCLAQKYKVRHNLFMELITADLRQLRAFEAVAVELNFVRAAERLHLSQPALSQTIKNLEASLGLQLFDRDTRRVALTEAGTLVLKEVRDVLARFQVFSDRAREIAKGQQRSLKVGYLIGAGVDIVPAIIRAFGEQFPDVNVILKEFDFSQPDAGIRSGMDLSILRPPIQDEGLEFVTLVEESCVVCMAEGHRLAKMDSVTIEDILKEAMIAAPGEGVWRDYWLLNGYRENQVAKVVYEAATFESEFQAVATGKGISITPLAAARFYARPGLAFRVISDMPPCKVSIVLPSQASKIAREFTKLATTLMLAMKEQPLNSRY